MEQIRMTLLSLNMGFITENKFIRHYMDAKGIGIFLLVAFLGLAAVLGILLLYARRFEMQRVEEDANEIEDWDAEEPVESVNKKTAVRNKKKKTGKNKLMIGRKTCWFIESFYELVFSSTSILFFLSIFLNTFLDHAVVSLRAINSMQKGALRLVSTIYMMLIFGYIRFIYDDLNYNELIIYFMGLVIGRFIYFDFTWKDFKETMRGVTKIFPLLLLIVSYSGLMCYVGFKSDFLLTANGVIVSVLIAHLFMDVSILIVHHFMKHFREDRQGKKRRRK